jgi:hypothetical protein
MKTRDDLKKIAVQMAEEKGLINLSRADLCAQASIPDGSFIHVMGCTFTDLVAEIRADGIDESKSHTISRRRVSPGIRKTNILDAALEKAKDVGYREITREEIAEQAGVSMGLVSRYLGTMDQIRKAIMRAAIRREVLEIVAQGLACGDDQARKADPGVKAAAAKLLADI